MGRKYLLTALALVSASPLSAAWHQASSDHFVIYADENEKDLRAFAERLERYHSAMSVQLNREQPKPSPSNRVTVYVVGSLSQVQKLYGEGASKYIGGFYTPRAGGSLAIIPELDKSGREVSDSERVLFHEYAHHFMYGSSSVAYPRWLSEGFAEFYAASKFEKDGSVGLGLPALHRAGELGHAVDVPVPLLLDSAAYLKKRSKAYDEFYGKSWALFHYLRFSTERQGQLSKYITLALGGKTDVDAAREAFGDLKILDTELNKYLRQSRMNYIKILPAALKVGEIKIRPLDDAETAIMPLVIQSKRGVDEKIANALVPKVRAAAAKYPQSAAAQAALAEAEFDAGNDGAAIAAADAALAAQPDNINALLQKGYAMARLAEKNESDSDPKRWSKVRAQFVKVNKVENDHPIPLIRYYQTYGEEGKAAPKVAIDGLQWALTLAPFDGGLRMMVAQQQLNDGQKEEAIKTLEPLAFSPHDSPLSKTALEMIEKAKAGDDVKEPASEADGDEARPEKDSAKPSG